MVPRRGTRRDDIRPGLRITHYKGRVAIAFFVEAQQVSIIGVYYGGQDYETALQEDSDGHGRPSHPPESACFASHREPAAQYLRYEAARYANEQTAVAEGQPNLVRHC